jgi:putative cardiolipin synthase
MTNLRTTIPMPLRGCLRALAGACAAVVLALASGCAGLPPLENRTDTFAIPPSEDGALGRAVLTSDREHPGLTGVTPVPDGRVAFGVRMQLVKVAVRTIDIQTFIWHDDATGTLLYDAVLEAAERGVRVRMLLDDANVTSAIDPILALLSRQPNLEIRLYNPFVSRGSKAEGFMTDFGRVNHRMHNKSFTVDNVVAVVGGRNIADEYFEAGEELGLVDLDVVAIGEAVGQVSSEFDLFWNSPSAYPARQILAGVEPMARDALAQRARAVLADPAAARYGEAIRNSDLMQGVLSGTAKPEWVKVTVVHDDPAKTTSPESMTEYQLLPKLEAAFGHPASALDLISPYFIPGKTGEESLAALAKRGVKVRVLTNSLAANDVKAAHAGYLKSRKELLEAGVQLLEVRPEASTIEEHAREIGHHSKAGLHAKTYQVDGRAIFVGSFNLDPRSSKLNTEMGLVIESPTLAGRLASALDKAFPAVAWRVSLDAAGDLQWTDGQQTWDTDPETSLWERGSVRFMSWLPIDWLL